MTAVLSIGSNMDDSRELLDSVYRDFAGKGQLRAASSIYRTPAWGVEDQPDFLNAILLVEVDRTPLELLHRGQELENAAGRVRVQKWGPRTLDVDIVAAWDSDTTEITSDTEELRLPHPHAHQRAFVLQPWLEVNPDAVLGGQRVAELLDELSDDEKAGITRGESFR
ncbi:2-amino-4-hydroxy-6-hydroxymethyldihydropteridine diphosphokinase [Corynebacterium propinquum]|uniref:2-amino-4-hydroxy-6-hydroxymethyldihydropteridine diphosphokinase n=1 Tax=Corynebacterium propinquum TaxID=43769 RepID=A0ABT7G221_9CORY|nr:2-amino-4-hydroxy-6-hydroxymethyldihydropteridine diphosphokinase [Corynebacterium propinquum]MCT1818158.1 2-amino-4-hydroxy-6-hydroxymethyldihydropteridine diphosphokinase [Corynebacterium propinquum]MDK4234891.1 2-amino-4-hydroxy-6-hydroxymethyldihydropteridine diphosphokinase [Corynebacterium propinquum]MDK4238434.1 2-amino-4-hydroxy-6-hydroxymethyldihydropteridine diphosphokinase [Corynebacterium propinquum]MDK4300765.1 2-amino-4-hydroxy-6-hydroxymethyldihydropteridine diphosphokinase [C